MFSLLSIGTKRAAMTTLSISRPKQTQAVESFAGVILIALDTEGRIEQINARGCEFLGFSVEELIGENWFLRCAPEPERQRAEYAGLLARVIDFPEHLLGRVQTRAGEVHSILWRSMLRKDSQGRVQGVLGSGTDLSDNRTTLETLVGDLARHKQAQHELLQRQAEINRARKQLAFASRMNTLGEIATGIAHEVNQPLAAIASYAKAGSRLLDSGKLSMVEARELFDKINHQAQRAGTVVHKVRSQISPPNKKHRSINMNTLLRDALDLIDVANDAADIKIDLDLTPELPAVEMDIIDLQQVTLSLMRNAIESMRDNQAALKILRICTRVVEPHSVLVTITDSGTGIARQHASRIYEPFFTTRKDCMGMGLAISRSIINAHNGVLRHCPAKPRGSKFYFTLPAMVKDH